MIPKGEHGIEFGNSGKLDTMEIDYQGHHAYYFFYCYDNKPYIIPFGESFSSIEEAFAAMKQNVESNDLTASIPEGLEFASIDDSSTTLRLQLNDQADIKNDQESLYTLEAILLVAKDFNFSAVKIDNAPVNEIGKFELNEEIEVPVAPNIETLQ